MNQEQLKQKAREELKQPGATIDFVAEKLNLEAQTISEWVAEGDWLADRAVKINDSVSAGSLALAKFSEEHLMPTVIRQNKMANMFDEAIEAALEEICPPPDPDDPHKKRKIDGKAPYAMKALAETFEKVAKVRQSFLQLGESAVKMMPDAPANQPKPMFPRDPGKMKLSGAIDVEAKEVKEEGEEDGE